MTTLKQPCPKCGGSDPVAINENGSAKCFSCGTFFPNYENPKKNTVNKSTYLNTYTGTYGALTDRGISEKVARKYGVRVVYNNDGSVAEHIYPFYNGNEIVGVFEQLSDETKKRLRLSTSTNGSKAI